MTQLKKLMITAYRRHSQECIESGMVPDWPQFKAGFLAGIAPVSADEIDRDEMQRVITWDRGENLQLAYMDEELTADAMVYFCPSVYQVEAERGMYERMG